MVMSDGGRAFRLLPLMECTDFTLLGVKAAALPTRRIVMVAISLMVVSFNPTNIIIIILSAI